MPRGKAAAKAEAVGAAATGRAPSGQPKGTIFVLQNRVAVF